MLVVTLQPRLITEMFNFNFFVYVSIERIQFTNG